MMSRTTIAVLVALAACKSADKPTTAPPPSAPAPAPAAAPAAGIALEPGERLVDRELQTGWDTPAGLALVSVVEKGEGGTFELVLTMPDGSRHVAVTTYQDRGHAVLRRVAQGVVFRWAIDADADKEGLAEDWLIVWSKRKGYPVQHKHWIGGTDDNAEPGWAGGKNAGTVAGGSPDLGDVDLVE